MRAGAHIGSGDLGPGDLGPADLGADDLGTDGGPRDACVIGAERATTATMTAMAW